MIYVNVKENESLDRALKKFKKKFEKTGVVKELRERQSFTKPCIKSRQQKIRAAYKLKLQREETGM
jgi:small subunit ribosomal protein S21